MTSSYLHGVGGTRVTPQRERIPGRADQITNSEGGYVFGLAPLERLARWLILGSESGSFYAGQREMTLENVTVLHEALAADGPGVIALLVDVSTRGRAPKQEPTIYALAAAASSPDVDTKTAALAALPVICRTASQLFLFLSFIEQFRGWGRALKRAVARWYENKTPDELAYQLVKYRNRYGFAHDDVLRLAHPDPNHSLGHAALYEWITLPPTGSRAPTGELPRIIRAYLDAQAAPTPADTARLVRDHRLPREALNTDHLREREVWEAMIDAGMPTGALLRNLATMTRHGILGGMGSPYQGKVLDQLTDASILRKARIHPVAVLSALLTYKTGRSLRGSATWVPAAQVVDALDDAFYKAFDAVEPTGKRHLLALDVSGSMHQAHVLGDSLPGLSSAGAAAAMMLVTAKSEDRYQAVAFGAPAGRYLVSNAYAGIPLGRGRRTQGVLQRGGRWGGEPAIEPFPLSARQRLDDVVNEMTGWDFGGTDCAAPMTWALRNEVEVDTFVIYTDNETWAGDIQPVQALRKYREQMGIDAKLITVAFAANGFSIADPTDAGMLDVVGFDTVAPAVMAEFTRGFQTAA